MNKAIFIDKDGTLIGDVPFNVDPAQIHFEPYAFESLLALQQKGFFLVVVTNQPGVGAGYFNLEDLKIVENKITTELKNRHVSLNGFYYCPHLPEDNCDCRKPKPGMLLKASRELDIDLSQSWMIGDILNDIEAGRSCGCKTILIDNGNETEWFKGDQRWPHYIVNHLKDAAGIISFHSV